jgi:hypothetical protein
MLTAFPSKKVPLNNRANRRKAIHFWAATVKERADTVSPLKPRVAKVCLQEQAEAVIQKPASHAQNYVSGFLVSCSLMQ